MKIFLLLPAFNEAENLPALLDKIVSLKKSQSLDLKTVLVDDGSQDETYNISQNFQSKLDIETIKHPVNKGLGEALRTGITHIAKTIGKDDVLVIMDADNSHSPKYIPSLIEKLNEGYDVAIASRFATGGKTFGVPFHRQIITKLASLTFRIFFQGCKVLDFTCGYRAYTGKCILDFIEHYKEKIITDNSFSSMAEICLKILNMGGKISEVPFELHYERKKGKSKMPFTRTVSTLLKLIIQIKFNRT